MPDKITSTNYTSELVRIDLPYFKELIDLISLERLCMDYENKMLKVENKGILTKEIESDEKKAARHKSKKHPEKRTYEPHPNDKQYDILTKCIEEIKLFRRPVKVTLLKKLLKGKLSEPLQVNNQKSLVYLFDKLKESKYIKATWMSVAEGNRDFISFRTEGNEQKYGNGPHYITMQQFQNNRKRNNSEFILGLDEIDDLIELLDENRDK